MTTSAGRGALVTGGSTGIGAAVAAGLAALGAKVAVHYNPSQAAAEAVAEAIRSAGGTAMLVGTTPARCSSASPSARSRSSSTRRRWI